MIYSLNYKSAYKQEADEIRCPYNQLGLIYNFIKENPNKRYVIVIEDLTKIDRLKEQIDYVKNVVEDNYTLACGSLDIMRFLLDKGFDKVYLDMPVTDWETFYQLQEFNVTDIWIDGFLGFNISTIVKKKNNTKIRVSPTYSPVALYKDKIRSETSFFIRPEDIDNYADGIDIIEFKQVPQPKEDTLFYIYKNGKWYLDIDAIISDLRPGVSNILLDFDDRFASRRKDCKQNCLSDGNCHHCKTCFDIGDIAKTLVKDNIENQ